MNILHIDSSARISGSETRRITAEVVAELGGSVTRRDLATPLPLLTEDWVGANFTAADQRSPDQQDTLALSDTLVDELIAADVIIIGAPIYNFSVPAVLKAWVDLIARVGRSFHYTENGPQGLLSGKRAIIAMASGGTPLGSDWDFATGYLRHIMGFVGITDVSFVSAENYPVKKAA